MNTTDLAGKVAVVTGGSRGLGRYITAALVEAGMRVGVMARSAADLEQCVHEFGDAALALRCDIGSAADVHAAVNQVVARWGRLDVLVNNAGTALPKLLSECSDEDVQRQVNTNLLGAIWCIRAAAPHLKAAKGDIVSITSESVLLPFPFLSIYAATKAAVEALSRGLKGELRADGVRVMVLRAGSMAESTFNREWPEAVSQRFFQAISESGHLAFSGAAMDPRIVAGTLVHALKTPREAGLDLFEVRAV